MSTRRQTFVPWEDVEQVLRKIKNAELRLRVAMCRYLDLRVDLEPPRLLWAKHVDFERRRLLVPCGKTKRYAGKPVRVVPIDDRLLPGTAVPAEARGDRSGMPARQ